MIPDVTPNGVFYLPPTGWLTSFYNPPQNKKFQFKLIYKKDNHNPALAKLIKQVTQK
jgi:cytochrome b561